MNGKDSFKNLKNIQEEFLNFLDNDEDVDVNFKNLIQLFKDTKILEFQHEFRLFLHMIAKVSNNYHHGLNFYSKIERILQHFKDDIKKIGKTRIFNFFKGNKRILLLLIDTKIIEADEFFIKQIIQKKYIKKKYPQYFAPEIKPFMNEEWFPKYDANKYGPKRNEWVEELNKELPNDFYEMRNKGENDSYLCKLIREDLIKEFIPYLNKNRIKRNSAITSSIYETNSFLIKKQFQSKENITLIEYAAFCGSIQILTFLKNENVELTPSLCINAIHSKNAELIHLLESECVKPTEKVEEKDKLYKEFFKESIKCHHNDFANYFLDKYLNKDDECSNDTIFQCIKDYNFSFLKSNQINESSFSLLCRYDYFTLAQILLASKNVNINSKEIQN